MKIKINIVIEKFMYNNFLFLNDKFFLNKRKKNGVNKNKKYIIL